jgi:hypothetical protein
MTDPDTHALRQRLRRYYTLIDQSTQIGRADGELHADSGLIAQVAALFSPDAIYERKNWPQAFAGRDSITHFFREQRELCGTHQVKDQDITFTPGIDAAIAGNVMRHFPALHAQDCITAKVTGTYMGAACFTGPEEGRYVKGAAGVYLTFEDSWVFNDKGQAVYRYSDIVATPQIRGGKPSGHTAGRS